MKFNLINKWKKNWKTITALLQWKKGQGKAKAEAWNTNNRMGSPTVGQIRISDAAKQQNGHNTH